MLYGLWMLVAGCGNPVATCDHFPASDCCETNEQCFNYYGTEFAYCSKPNRPHGGVCSECAADRDCIGDAYCYLDDAFGVCRDPDTCYEVGTTGCTYWEL